VLSIELLTADWKGGSLTAITICLLVGTPSLCCLLILVDRLCLDRYKIDNVEIIPLVFPDWANSAAQVNTYPLGRAAHLF
jgi:hypothetical protein